MRACLVLFAIVFSGCSLLGHESTPERGPRPEGAPEGLVLFGGTSFGECLGYCITELVVSDRTAVLVYSGWEIRQALPDIRHERRLTAAERAALDRAFDRAALRRADDVYGCPDCADGGAEWVGAAEGGEEKRVTFEYGRNVREVAALITVMRDLRASFPAPPRD